MTHTPRKLPTLVTLAALSGLVACSYLQNYPFSIATAQLPQSSRQAQANSSLEALEKAVHTQINQYRASRGLPPLTIDTRIRQQALAHSQAMASGKVPFSHNGFDQRVKAIATALPYRSAAENVAYNMGYQNPDRQAVQGWIKSPGHRKNIEGQFDTTGIAIARNAKGEYYFTQIFIRRR